MVAMLLHVEGVPVLRVRHTKDKIYHLGRTILRSLNGERRLRVYSAKFVVCGNLATGFGLRKDAGAVSKGVSDRCPECPWNLLQNLLEVGIEGDVLVDSEIDMRKVLE